MQLPLKVMLVDEVMALKNHTLRIHRLLKDS